MGEFRIGHGYDVHKLVEGRALILGGVTIPHTLGLLGHSDADVLVHAIMDALRIYDGNSADYCDTALLKDLPLNTTFVSPDGRVFKMLEKRRTRYKCILLSTGQIYLVPGSMRVKTCDIE